MSFDVSVIFCDSTC